MNTYSDQKPLDMVDSMQLVHGDVPMVPGNTWNIPDPKWRERFAQMDAGEEAGIVPENPVTRFFRVWRDWWNELLGN